MSTAEPIKTNGGERWPLLFSPAHLCGLPLRNRLVLGPMTRISATEDGCATAAMADYYAQLARGGFGLLIAEATYVDEAWSQACLALPADLTGTPRDRSRRTLSRSLSASGSGLSERY